MKKKIQYKLTEFLSQFEINAEMEISKKQWRSTGGKTLCLDFVHKIFKN